MTDMIEIINQRFKKLEDKVGAIDAQQDHDSTRITYVNQLAIDLQKRMERVETLENRLDIEAKEIWKVKERIDRLENRLQNKELEISRIFPSEKRLTDILREQLPNHDVEVRFVGNIRKCMSAKEAMKALFDGYKITRECWENEKAYMKIGDPECLDIGADELLANDWYVIE